MLMINESKGFQMSFGNGNTVSVQFGKFNYCENRDKPSAFDKNQEIRVSKDAEVAAWDESGVWYNFGYDTVMGWLTADQVQSFIGFVASSNLQKDRWVDEGVVCGVQEES